MIRLRQVAVRVRPLRADEGPRIIHVVSDKVTAIYSMFYAVLLVIYFGIM